MAKSNDSKESRKEMLERNERLLEYCARLYALGFKPRAITEKAMEVNDPSPLFLDPSNRESCMRITRTVLAKVENLWTEKQAKMHPHAVGTYIAKKETFEASLWPLATARPSTVVREYVVEDPVTKRTRRVKETTTTGPHPIVQAAAIRELGKTIDDLATVLGVDVRGRRHDDEGEDDKLFRQTADELLNAHEERRRERLAAGAIDVDATNEPDGDDDGGPRSGGRTPPSVM